MLCHCRVVDSRDDCCCEYLNQNEFSSLIFIRMCLPLKAIERLTQRFLELYSQNRTQHCFESSSLTWFVFFAQQPPRYTAVTNRSVSSLHHGSVFDEQRQHVLELCMDSFGTSRCGHLQRVCRTLNVFQQDDHAMRVLT